MKKQPELNYMNAIAALLVILIHVLSLGISTADRTSWQAAVIYLPWRLAAFVVPMFLYTGGVKMARQFQDRPITLSVYLRYCLRRIGKIYLPYVLWVCIYYALFLPIGYVRGEAPEFFRYLLLGNLVSPFYYIIIVMQFYFLMPLWLWMVRHLPAHLGLSIALLVTLAMQQCGHIFSLFGVDFPYADRVFPTYLIFWVMGLYVGRYYHWAVDMLRRQAHMGLCAGVALVCALLAYIAYAGDVYLFNMANLKLVSDALSILLVHALCLRLAQRTGPLQTLLGRIYHSSFFVYLSHCLFLTLVTAHMQGRGINGLTPLLLARFAVCYTVPFLAYYVYHKLLSALRCPLRPLG